MPTTLLAGLRSHIHGASAFQIHALDSAGSSAPYADGGGAAAEGGAEDDCGAGLLPPTLNMWRPKGALCAHLHEHKAAINAFSVSTDGSYFVSASDDGTVKLWPNNAAAQMGDASGTQLELWQEPALTESRVTYDQQSGRILDVSTYGGGGAYATASDTGSIHCIAIVDGGILRMRRIAPQEGAVTKLATVPNAPDLLIYATEGGSIHASDKRTPTEPWVWHNLAPYGLTTGLVVANGGDWLAASSSRGFVSVWDIRFQVRSRLMLSSLCLLSCCRLCIFVANGMGWFECLRS